MPAHDTTPPGGDPMPSAVPVRSPLPRPARVAFVALAAMPLAGAVATPARAGDTNLNFYPLSGRSLEKDFWSPVENQLAFGGTVDFGEKGLPLHFALGFHTGLGLKNYSNQLLDDVASTV